MLAKRAYNLREGWRPEDDWLPERFLSEELTVGSGRTAALTPATLRSMIEGYYAARGLDAQGRPAGLRRRRRQGRRRQGRATPIGTSSGGDGRPKW